MVAGTSGKSVFSSPITSSFTSVADAGLAREAAGADGVLRGVAAGRVGQDREAVERQVVEEVLLARVGDVHAPDRDGDDLGARRPRSPAASRRTSAYLPVPTMSRERYSRPARTKGSSSAHHQPPPTKWMISTASPSRETVARVVGARHDRAVHLDRDAPRARGRAPRPGRRPWRPSRSSRGSSFTITCTSADDHIDHARG